MFDMVLILRNAPSPLMLLAIISRFEQGITLGELTNILEELQKHGIDLGYKFVPLIKTKISKELMLDLNLLKVLNLIVDNDGKIMVTEKAKLLLSKLYNKDATIKRIMTMLIRVQPNRLNM